MTQFETVPLASIVKDLSRVLIDQGKSILLKTGAVPRTCWVFCAAASIRQARSLLPFFLIDAETGEEREIHDFRTGESQVIAMLDLNADDAVLLKMYEICDPRFARIRPLLMDMMNDMAVPESEKLGILVKQLVRINNAPHEGWIVTQYVKHVIRALNADAYIHLCETWVRQDPSFSTDKTEKEALLLVWSTRKERGALNLPFERSEKGTGRVTAFEECQEDLDIEGPLFDVLIQAPMN